MFHKITWLHKLVYTAEGQPAAYDDLSGLMFVNRYITVMEEQENGSIKPLLPH